MSNQIPRIIAPATPPITVAPVRHATRASVCSRRRRSSAELGPVPTGRSASRLVETRNTAPAVREIVRELEELTDDRPLTAAELDHAKSSLVRGFPRTLETVGDLQSAVREVVLHGLPDDHFNTYVERIQAVTLDAANRAAADHIHPDRLAVIVVGDAKVIRSELEALQLGPIEERDLDGAPV